MKIDLEMMENMHLRLSCLFIVTIFNKMTERRACDIICVNERIFVRSLSQRIFGNWVLIFVSPLNFRCIKISVSGTCQVLGVI